MGKLNKPMEGLITDIWSQNFIPRTFRKIIRIELELQSSILDSRVELHTSKKIRSELFARTPLRENLFHRNANGPREIRTRREKITSMRMAENFHE